jgi:hypothetical protein
MSVDMIEAAWTDPMLRRELAEKGDSDIPDHPVGILKGFPDLSPKAEVPYTAGSQCTAQLECGYYFNSYFECNSTYSVSGEHCCQ